MLTSGSQLAMMIIIILGYFQVIEAPQGPFIGIVAFILLGQIGTQVCYEMQARLVKVYRHALWRLQLQDIVHERIMLVLELADQLLRRFAVYKHVQKYVMDHLVR